MLIGSLLSLIAAILYTVGNLMEKVAVNKMSAFSVNRLGHMVKTLMSSRLWMAGFVISLVGLAVQVLAFSKTPILVVQAIFGGGIVLLVLVSHAYLHEPLHRLEVIGLSVAVPALVLVTISLGGSSGAVGVSGSELSVLGYAVLTLAVAAACYLGLRHRFGRLGFLYGMTSGLAYGVATLGSKGSATLVDRHGVVGALPEIFSSPYPYLFVIASGLGLVVFQSGLQHCRIAVVSPTSSVASSVYVVIVGTLLFGEHLPSDHRVLILRLAGFVGVLIGSCFLTRSEPGETDVAVDAPHLGLRTVEEQVITEHDYPEDSLRR